MNTYRPTARNYSDASENRMHNDDTAQRFGFQGALVPGVAVFGHMTYPLMKSLGARWLGGYSASIRLIKPAYDGDELTIEHTEEDGQHLVRCIAREELLSELRSSQDTPPVNELALLAGGPPIDPRPEIAWDLVQTGKPFPAFHWVPSLEEHLTYTTQIDDDLEIYHGDVLHPHAILSTANRALSKRFKLPAWLHVGSEVCFRELVHIDDDIEVRTVPTQKWRNKGHEFIEIYVAYLVDGVVKTEIRHTAIFKVAQRAA